MRKNFKVIIYLTIVLMLALLVPAFAASSPGKAPKKGSSSSLSPIAYGYINSLGEKITGTANLTSILQDGILLLSIEGENFVPPNYIVTVTPVAKSPCFAVISQDNNNILVNIYNGSGEPFSTDLQVMVYKTNDTPLQLYYNDSDQDTYGKTDDAKYLTAPEATYTATRGGDCDDTDSQVNPEATEICGNSKDDNCDGTIDERCTVWNLDNDGDGFGNPSVTTLAPDPRYNYVTNGLDCDDQDPNINPDAVEICGTGRDEDCDGAADEDGCYWYRDADKDGYGDPDINNVMEGPLPIWTLYDYVSNHNDCDDNDANVHPGAQEICGNGKDDDCDGSTDENCSTTPAALTFNTPATETLTLSTESP